jgi:hypothetical protein
MFWNIVGVLVIIGLLNALMIINASEGWEDEGGYHQFGIPRVGSSGPGLRRKSPF